MRSVTGGPESPAHPRQGTRAAGDGCSATCRVEHGFACAGQPSVCAATCGDGVRASTEACDDGNVAVGDGCDASCAVEPGWTCDAGTEPSNCHNP